MADAISVRVLFQGEGKDSAGEWFGFYAARETQAVSLDEGLSQLAAVMARYWETEAGQDCLRVLRLCTPIAAWTTDAKAPLPTGGHTFYNDDASAQRAAFRIEARVCELPREVRKRLAADLPPSDMMAWVETLLSRIGFARARRGGR